MSILTINSSLGAVTSPPVKEKIKSISGRMMTWCNQIKLIRTVLNPNNKKQTDGFFNSIGKIVRFVLRFFVGTVAGFVGGVLGTIWHLGGAIFWGGSRENRLKHLQSAGADCFRAIFSPLTAGLGFASCPDNYFAKGDTRSDGSLARSLTDAPAFENEVMVFGIAYCVMWLSSQFLSLLSALV